MGVRSVVRPSDNFACLKDGSFELNSSQALIAQCWWLAHFQHLRLAHFCPWASLALKAGTFLVPNAHIVLRYTPFYSLGTALAFKQAPARQFFSQTESRHVPRMSFLLFAPTGVTGVGVRLGTAHG